MTIPAPPSRWQQLHSNLEANRAVACKQEVQRVLGCSQSAFYRKLKLPASRLSIAEKEAIAKAYGLEPGYLFPEMGAVKAPQQTGT